MTLSQKSIDEFKEIYKKEHGKELTDAEASESARNLVGFFELLWEVSIREAKHKKRLEKERRWFNTKWSRQEKEIRKIMDDTYGMYGDLQAATGRALPEIKSLELPSPESTESTVGNGKDGK